jgi:hypothetical protein
VLKYRGQFRILYETDKRTGQAAEFTFAPCRIRPGANIYRFNDDTLAACIPGSRTANRLLQEHPGIFRSFQTGDSESSLLFDEKNIDRAAAILLPRVKGKNMSARPKRSYTLTEEQKRIRTERLKVYMRA